MKERAGLKDCHCNTSKNVDTWASDYQCSFLSSLPCSRSCQLMNGYETIVAAKKGKQDQNIVVSPIMVIHDTGIVLAS